jgi:hypothetical protein
MHCHILSVTPSLLGVRVAQYARLSRQKMSKWLFFSDMSKGICHLNVFDKKTYIKVFQTTEICEEMFYFTFQDNLIWKPENTTVGIRRADHETPSICKSWH